MENLSVYVFFVSSDVYHPFVELFCSVTTPGLTVFLAQLSTKLLSRDRTGHSPMHIVLKLKHSEMLYHK